MTIKLKIKMSRKRMNMNKIKGMEINICSFCFISVLIINGFFSIVFFIIQGITRNQTQQNFSINDVIFKK